MIWQRARVSETRARVKRERTRLRAAAHPSHSRRERRVLHRRSCTDQSVTQLTFHSVRHACCYFAVNRALESRSKVTGDSVDSPSGTFGPAVPSCWLQSFFHHHHHHNHHHHHRSSVVPTAVPRLVPETGGGLLGGIAQITPSLFLSRGNVASNRSLLLSKGITCVVNATIELPNFNWPHVEYVKVPLADMPHSPISLYFDSVADKIHSVGRKRGAVLVHCAAGVSRSASLCLAYLMKYHRVSLAEAHAWVKARRPVIRPNGGFWRQLIEYERKLFGRNSVKMVQTPYGVIPDVYERDRRNLAPYWCM
ncbi:dual specificity protein phosphatase 14 [Arapaima gigas]